MTKSEAVAVIDEPARRAVREGWEVAERLIRDLGRLEEDWDGSGAPPIPAALIQSALGLASLLAERGDAPPQNISPLSDGNIVLEWRFAEGVIQRIEVEGPGQGTLMTSAPGKRARFVPFAWAEIPPLDGDTTDNLPA